MTTTIRFALPIALLLAAATARAQSEPVAKAGGYALQLALTDAAALGTAAAGFSIEGRDGPLNYIPSNTLMAVGGVGYFLGAPIVHVTRGQYGRAGVSLAMRVTFPFIGAAIGARTASCTPDAFLCGLDEMGAGFAVGAVTAALTDNALTALLSAPASTLESERVAAAGPAPGVRLTPRLVATQNLTIFGVGGQF